LSIVDRPIAEPGPGEVRVRIHAIGLNRAEIMYRSGHYAVQPAPGSRIGVEAAGVVEALGAGGTRFRVGDRVSILQTIQQQIHGVYAEHSVVPETSLVASPAEFDDIEAAAFWHAAAMAYGPLVMRAGIGRDDVVLVTAASSGVGLATIQGAKAEGATVIAVTRGGSKRAALEAAGADHVIATAEEDLVARVLAVTGGKGASVISDSVLGPQLALLADAAAPGARLIVSGLLDGTEIRLPIWPVLLKGLVIEGFVGFLAVEADPKAMAAFERHARTHIAHGRLRPVIDRTFTLDEIAQAHRYMEAGAQVGKIVVVPR
jgi:NADPH:quinone reductase-like Zn-dependent oxidoreductase